MQLYLLNLKQETFLNSSNKQIKNSQLGSCPYKGGKINNFIDCIKKNMGIGFVILI